MARVRLNVAVAGSLVLYRLAGFRVRGANIGVMTTELNVWAILAEGDDALTEAAFRTGDFGRARELLESARDEAASGGDVARGGVLEDDFTLAKLDPAGCSIGQEDDFHRHLVGKTENICGVGPGGLKPDRVAADQRLGHRVSGCGHAAQCRMVNRIIVKPPRELANNAFARKAGQSHAD